MFCSSCNMKKTIYKIDNEIILTTRKNLNLDWIYLEDYISILEQKYHLVDYYEKGILIDAILNVEWNKVESSTETIMDGKVKSILRTGIFDDYIYLDDSSDVIVSGIIKSDNVIYKYPEYAYKIINNNVELVDSFQFVDISKMKLKNTETIYDLDVNRLIVEDVRQLAYCESEISEIIIPKQYTENKVIPEFAFYNTEKLNKIEVLDKIGNINPYAFSNTADEIVICKDVNIIEPKAFMNCEKITINGNINNNNKYSFENCNKIYYKDEIKQIIDNNLELYNIMDIYLDLNYSYNLNNNINIKYLPYFNFSIEHCEKFNMSYSINEDNEQNSNIIESYIISEGYNPYYAQYEKYNRQFNELCWFNAIKIDDNQLFNLNLTKDEFNIENGDIYIYMKLIDEQLYNLQIYTQIVKITISYEIVNNNIYFKYKDCQYFENYTDFILNK